MCSACFSNYILVLVCTLYREDREKYLILKNLISIILKVFIKISHLTIAKFLLTNIWFTTAMLLLYLFLDVNTFSTKFMVIAFEFMYIYVFILNSLKEEMNEHRVLLSEKSLCIMQRNIESLTLLEFVVGVNQEIERCSDSSLQPLQKSIKSNFVGVFGEC